LQNEKWFEEVQQRTFNFEQRCLGDWEKSTLRSNEKSGESLGSLKKAEMLELGLALMNFLYFL